MSEEAIRDYRKRWIRATAVHNTSEELEKKIIEKKEQIYEHEARGEGLRIEMHVLEEALKQRQEEGT